MANLITDEMLTRHRGGTPEEVAAILKAALWTACSPHGLPYAVSERNEQEALAGDRGARSTGA